jgi:hypothetical protein
MKDAILELREKHPGWGAQTLRLEIAKDKRFAGLRSQAGRGSRHT